MVVCISVRRGNSQVRHSSTTPTAQTIASCAHLLDQALALTGGQHFQVCVDEALRGRGELDGHPGDGPRGQGEERAAVEVRLLLG